MVSDGAGWRRSARTSQPRVSLGKLASCPLSQGGVAAGRIEVVVDREHLCPHRLSHQQRADTFI